VISMSEVGVGAVDWVGVPAALDSCSSSSLILLLRDSTSRAHEWLDGVEAAIELVAVGCDDPVGGVRSWIGAEDCHTENEF
jgi:hypothetical protein